MYTTEIITRYFCLNWKAIIDWCTTRALNYTKACKHTYYFNLCKREIFRLNYMFICFPVKCRVHSEALALFYAYILISIQFSWICWVPYRISFTYTPMSFRVYRNFRIFWWTVSFLRFENRLTSYLSAVLITVWQSPW